MMEPSRDETQQETEVPGVGERWHPVELPVVAGVAERRNQLEKQADYGMPRV